MERVVTVSDLSCGQKMSAIPQLAAAILLATVLWHGLLPGGVGAQEYPLFDEGTQAAVPEDPLAGFNQTMFSFNLKLDKYILRPVASGYAKVVPTGGRRGVGRFFRNLDVAPRFGNKLIQLELGGAGIVLGRFVINTTLGGLGFFDVANSWFALSPQYADFGQTLWKYGVPSGPYLVLPFWGPSTIRDGVGLAADGAMQPLNYLVPFWPEYVAARGGWVIGSAVNSRSLNLELFEDVDRFALDLYGAVQDGYMQRRDVQLRGE